VEKQNSMNVALPPELEKRVHESLDKGEFANPDEFFRQAAELLLEFRHGDGSPMPVDESWNGRVEALLKEAEASGEATEMTERDWQEVERQGIALMRARKKA
jgi:Arc/MetJ-type ribon-helix-helix transcriptional regulator